MARTLKPMWMRHWLDDGRLAAMISWELTYVSSLCWLKGEALRPGFSPGTKKETVSCLTNLMLNALLRQADSERMAVLKLRGTGHQLSILPLAVTVNVSRGEGYKCSFFHGIQ
uniref:Uncharacterized protein n=1 Tax=Salix viminalis TaxID=40686 RepID=A0A6N2K775_SALVM